MARRVPGATYRLQLTPSFGFADARGIVDYLDGLGITDLYASPVFAARPGSLHGYDVTDPTRLNPERGGGREFRRLADALRRRGMGLILDIVPNHMSATEWNAWWRDVLRSGPTSRYARVFDIDWDSPRLPREARGKVVLPILGDTLEDVLGRGELLLLHDGRGLSLAYMGRRLPVSPSTLGTALRGLREVPRTSADRERLAHRVTAQRHRDAGRRVLERLLRAQHYVLVDGRSSPARRNYRRFFNVDDLVGVRVEDPWVFDLTHRLLLQVARLPAFSGVRIDHIDGLADPEAYLRTLAAALRGARPRRDGGSPYVAVEKILAPDESLPSNWPVAGTTGYDFLNAANGAFVSATGYSTLARSYARLAGTKGDLADAGHEAKTHVLRHLFRGEIERLVDDLDACGPAGEGRRAIPRAALRASIIEVTSRLPVYRTYGRRGRLTSHDRRIVEDALRQASRGATSPDGKRAVRRLRAALLGPPSRGERPRARERFVRRWQQFTGAATAKGLEDTAFYRYVPLASLNEVGGHPRVPELRFGPEAFHRAMVARARRWPHAMSTTSTHDTKRSEDVRMRINVLSEIPGEWARRVEEWRALNRSARGSVGGRDVPDPNEEWFVYQTLVGAWPFRGDELAAFRARLRDYVVKVAREAKVHTSWRAPDPARESALVAFVDALSTGSGAFSEDFLPFQRRIAAAGARDSLSLVVLKVASPGVPDFYQGTELWDLSLVDPDNRRPVDFGRRREIASGLGPKPGDGIGYVANLWNDRSDGRIKFLVTRECLRARRRHTELFRDGRYVPLRTRGSSGTSGWAFARRRGQEWAIAIVGRAGPGFFARGEPHVDADEWEGAQVVLPESAPREWVDAITGVRIRAARAGGRTVLSVPDVFAAIPCGLLIPGTMA